MKIGFTGTSRSVTPAQTAELLIYLRSRPGCELHHGCCVGADATAHKLAKALGYDIVIHPPTNTYKMAVCEGATRILPAAPYLTRNHDIVDACDVLVACPATSDEVQRSGTWATIRYAVKRRKNILIICPDGQCTKL